MKSLIFCGPAFLIIGCATHVESSTEPVRTSTDALGIIANLPAGSVIFGEVPLKSRDSGFASVKCNPPTSTSDSVSTWYELDLSSLSGMQKTQLKSAIKGEKAYATLNIEMAVDTTAGTSASTSVKMGVIGYESGATGEHKEFSNTLSKTSSSESNDGTVTRHIALQVPTPIASLDWTKTVIWIELFGTASASCIGPYGAGPSATATVDSVSAAVTGGYEGALWIAP